MIDEITHTVNFFTLMSNQDRVSPHNIDTAEKVVDTLIDKTKRLIKSSRFISFNGYEMFAV